MAVEEGYIAAVEAFRRKLLVEALEEAGDSPRQAARLLKLNRTHFHKLMAKYGISRKVPHRASNRGNAEWQALK